MKKILEFTLWEMKTPSSYGAFHIIASIIVISSAILFAWKLRNVKEKGHKRILAIVGFGLLIFEVYKILIHAIVDPYGWGFLGAFPFQLCSIPMYLSLICLLPINEKVKTYFYEFMFSVNMFGVLIAFIEPSGINHPYITLTIHAYIWHASLIFLGLYLYFSKKACTDKKSFYKVVSVYLIACFIAQIINIIFKDSTKINNFYISPYNQTPIIVFNDIWARYGWLVNMILYVVAIILVSCIIYYIGYSFRLLKSKKSKES